MIPKDKALELIIKFKNTAYSDYLTTDKEYNNAKQCALIAVDEILDLKHIVTLRKNMHEMELEYWMEVKQEIEKL